MEKQVDNTIATSINFDSLRALENCNKQIRDGVLVVTSEEPAQAIGLTSDLLQELVDKETALLLSGGLTPEPLYRLSAKKKSLNVGAVGVVDERFGEPYHEKSNEKMFQDSGLLNYFENKNIPFHSVLRGKQDLENLAEQYDERIRDLFGKFGKKVAILGIGEDGHIASLPVGIEKSKAESQNYVETVDDFPKEPRKRITLTFKALSEMDVLIVLVLGANKKGALDLMFEKGPIEEIPARFFAKPDIAKKVILITDQKV